MSPLGEAKGGHWPLLDAKSVKYPVEDTKGSLEKSIFGSASRPKTVKVRMGQGN